MSSRGLASPGTRWMGGPTRRTQPEVASRRRRIDRDLARRMAAEQDHYDKAA